MNYKKIKYDEYSPHYEINDLKTTIEEKYHYECWKEETLLDNDSMRYKRNKKKEFHDNLEKKGLEYFVYFKFCIYEGKSYAIVVGKTGTHKVNSYGPDVNFTVALEDGLSRQWLKEKNATWDQSYIFIIKADSCADALKKEKEMVMEFQLFEA